MIHRRIGMSGRLLAKAIARQQRCTLSEEQIDKLDAEHAQRFHELAPTCGPLPGAVELLAYLADLQIPHGIATSGKRSEIEHLLKAHKLSPGAIVVDGDMVREVKPEPDLFLLCQQTLKTAAMVNCS